MQNHLKPESAFGFEAPENSPGFLLWQTTVTWQRLIKKALDDFEISHAQFVIMALLLWLDEKKQDPTQVAISRLSKLDKMTVSKSLKKLIVQGYVTRQESKKDTRAKWTHLSAKGKKLVSTLIPIVEGIDAEFFSVVNKNDQKSLIQILIRIMNATNE